MNLGNAERLARINAVDRSAHVYLVDLEKVYFKVYRDISLIRHKFSCVYLGIGNEPAYLTKLNYPVKGKQKSNPFDVKVKIKKPFFKPGMKCCYCEIVLNEKSCTKEHVIPKYKGGNIIKPCCSKCNTEKGGMTLGNYIIFLESKPQIIFRDKIKIQNANLILEEIFNDTLKKAANLK